jgi:hypothetical protein
MSLSQDPSPIEEIVEVARSGRIGLEGYRLRAAEPRHRRGEGALQ